MTDDILHKMAMEAVGFAFQLLEPQAEHLAKLVKAEAQMHSFLHITDPTAYRTAINSENLRRQVRMANAALAFVAELRAVRDEVSAEATS
jgi:hypothetical protein